MRILALDLGTHTGYAYHGLGGFNSGTKILATPKQLREAKERRLDRRGDIRVIAFWEWLTQLHVENQFDTVVFEDVQFSSSTAQTQLWSSFRAAVWLAFPGVLIEAVPVGTLKKFASGSGAADKPTMLAALVRRFPEFITLGKVQDDNEIDACWLYLWAGRNLSRTKL